MKGLFGRRHDGRRIKDIDPIVRVTPHLMPMRVDGLVYLEHRMDFELLTRYIAKKAAQGEKLTYLQILIAAYVRAVSRNPQVNRFIMNKQYFARNNCSVAFTMLRDSQNYESAETVVKVKFDLTDTVFDVRDRVNAALEKNRQAEEGNTAEKVAKAAFMIPGIASFLGFLIRVLDRYGILPSMLIEELPFHVGLYLTNNASIGLHHVLHHIYNFGSVSLFFGMGSVVRETVLDAEGKPKVKRYIPVGVTADERVTSGAHYAAFFADVVSGLNNPESLETPPETVMFDNGLEYHEPKVRQTDAMSKAAG